MVTPIYSINSGKMHEAIDEHINDIIMTRRMWKRAGENHEPVTQEEVDNAIIPALLMEIAINLIEIDKRLNEQNKELRLIRNQLRYGGKQDGSSVRSV